MSEGKVMVRGLEEKEEVGRWMEAGSRNGGQRQRTRKGKEKKNGGKKDYNRQRERT